MEPSSARYQSRRHSILTPSPVGIVLYTFLTGLIIVLNQFNSIEHYLQVPQSVQLGHIMFTGADHILTRVLGTGRTASLVVGIFWAIVGLGVYVFLRGVARLVTDLGEGYESKGFVWPKGANRNSEIRRAVQREMVRVLAFIGLLIVVFGPLAAIVNGPVLVSLAGSDMVPQLIVWFVAGWVLLHIAVILLRLVALKPRLFS